VPLCDPDDRVGEFSEVVLPQFRDGEAEMTPVLPERTRVPKKVGDDTRFGGWQTARVRGCGTHMGIVIDDFETVLMDVLSEPGQLVMCNVATSGFLPLPLPNESSCVVMLGHRWAKIAIVHLKRWNYNVV
jgi:hypothetical protein